MIAEILATGDEIRSGALIDSNSAYIAEKLQEAGIPVTRHNCVGDDLDVLISILKEISTRVDICVVTGGLGPTTDDLSSEAAAAAADETLLLDTQALSDIKAFFRSRKRDMAESNRKQALLPRTAEVMYNPIGTAPGFRLKIDRCVFFFLPGVPPEMKRMLAHEVFPRIEKMPGASKVHCLVRNISTFGLTESATGEKVADILKDFPEIKLGLRAKFPEIHVKLYLNGQDRSYMETRLAEAARWIKDRLGRHVLSLEGLSLPEVVGNLLRERSATVALAESCTGGRIANWLTDSSGSSDYFVFSGVTYSNDSKTNVLGVAPALLKEYGAVHEETAKAMAEGARRISGASYAISTTGIAGPSGGTDDKPVGTVCIGLATADLVTGKRICINFGQRTMNKSIFGMAALDMLRKELLKR